VQILINYFRRTSQAELTAQEARARGVNAHIIKANVGDPEKIDSMFQVIEAKFGRQDILITQCRFRRRRPAMELGC
jgi:enoyl-[acyl-carrier protein] reductase III